METTNLKDETNGAACGRMKRLVMWLVHHWEENIKPAIQFFIAGFFIAAGLITAHWVIPAKPVEYQICIQDAGGDYICEVYR